MVYLLSLKSSFKALFKYLFKYLSFFFVTWLYSRLVGDGAVAFAASKAVCGAHQSRRHLRSSSLSSNRRWYRRDKQLLVVGGRARSSSVQAGHRGSMSLFSPSSLVVIFCSFLPRAIFAHIFITLFYLPLLHGELF